MEGPQENEEEVSSRGRFLISLWTWSTWTSTIEHSFLTEVNSTDTLLVEPVELSAFQFISCHKAGCWLAK